MASRRLPLSPSLIPLALLALTGCSGSGNMNMTTPPANTSVTLLATSTANDKLSALTLSMESLMLTSQSGTTVTLFSAEQGEEFLHVNGPMEPILTGNIPPGTYTSATLTLNSGLAYCAGVAGAPANLTIDGFAAYQTIDPVDVSLPQPITISGSSTLLALNLQLASTVKPFTFCTPGVTQQVQSMTPDFTLTAVNSGSSAMPVFAGMKGVIQSTTASGFSVGGNLLFGVGEFSPSWQVTTNSATAFHGVSGLSALSTGMAVDFDASVQPNGTLLATRVSVYDTTTSNTTLTLGPVLNPIPAQSITPMLLSETSPVVPYGATYNYASPTTFAISTQLANLAQLPFQPRFDAAHIVGGQNTLAILHLASTPPSYVQPSTLVLIPQTVDGLVTATATAGAFTTYTITLAPYDLFPNTATLGDSNPLTQPNTIIVYADASASMQTASPIATGNTYRFNGLVFDDNGTLRMDCDAIYDGPAL